MSARIPHGQRGTRPTLLYIEEYFEDLKRLSKIERCSAGCVVGWCVGYLALRMVKMVSATIGIFCLLTLITHQLNMIDIPNVEKMCQVRTSSQIVNKTKMGWNEKLTRSFQKYVITNAPFAVGFSIGAMLGIAAS